MKEATKRAASEALAQMLAVTAMLVIASMQSISPKQQGRPYQLWIASLRSQ